MVKEPRLFRAIRTKDVSGISGCGTVAHGVLWGTGQVTVMWVCKEKKETLETASSIEDWLEIHGHSGNTFVEYINWGNKMGLIKINNTKITTSDIDINPYVDENSNIVFESITVTCTEIPIHLKEQALYDGEVEGDNEDTGKKESYPFKSYKLASIESNKLTLIHPDFMFKYELEMYSEPKA